MPGVGGGNPELGAAVCPTVIGNVPGNTPGPEGFCGDGKGFSGPGVCPKATGAEPGMSGAAQSASAPTSAISAKPRRTTNFALTNILPR